MTLPCLYTTPLFCSHQIIPTTLKVIRYFPLTQRVASYGIQYFDYLQNGIFLGFGFKEVLLDCKESRPIPPLTETEKLANQAKKRFYLIHGSLFILSGLAGFGFIIYKVHLLFAISLGLFSLANLLSLRYNYNLYMTHADPKIRQAAALEIASNVAYLLSAVFLIYGPGATLSFALGILGALLGSIKIVIDIFIALKQQLLSKKV